MTSDIVIVGGGVIGLSIAWELSGAGLRVTVLDQKEMGQEASWAGAGMIPPGDIEDPATHPLAVLSEQRWATFSAALRNESGIDNEYHRCGGILLPGQRSIDDLIERWRSLHVTTERIDSARLQEIEPSLDSSQTPAVWLPEMAQVRNPRHLKALITACESRGVQLLSGEEVISWKRNGERLLSAVTRNAEHTAAEFLIAAGAWTSRLLEPLGQPLTVEPVLGQIALLQAQPGQIRRIIEEGKQYIVPRRDGRVLVGATEERIGFQKRNTEAAIAQLVEFARSKCPVLKDAPLIKTWSGLRPWCGHGRPVLGNVPGYSNLFLAAGHFRAGLSNSPGTALVMRQLILGEPPNIDLSAFAL